MSFYDKIFNPDYFWHFTNFVMDATGRELPSIREGVDIIRPFAAALVALFFLMEFYQIIWKLSGKNIFGLLAKTMIIGCLSYSGLAYSRTVFNLTLPVQNVSKAIYKEADIKWNEVMNAEVSKLIEAREKGMWDFIKSFGKMTIINLFASGSWYLCKASVYILNCIQKLEFALYYILGPFLLSFLMWSRTKNIALQWIKRIFCIAFYGVVASIILHLLSSINFDIISATTIGAMDMFKIMCINISIFLIFLGVPALTATFFGLAGTLMSPGAMAFGAISAIPVVGGAAGKLEDMGKSPGK